MKKLMTGIGLGFCMLVYTISVAAETLETTASGQITGKEDMNRTWQTNATTRVPEGLHLCRPMGK
jgi:hypothetical protein